MDWEAWARRVERALDVAGRGDWQKLFAPGAVPAYGYNEGGVAFGFRVDDIEAASRELAAAGCELLGEVTRMRRINYAYREFRGPDGRVYGINEQQAPGNKQQALEKKHSSSANSAAGFGIWSLELFWSLELWAYSLGARRFLFLLLLLAGTSLRGFGVIRDGGIDPANLGKGDWIYATADATNKLGGHVNSVTNETSLMLFRSLLDLGSVATKLVHRLDELVQFLTNRVHLTFQVRETFSVDLDPSC